MSRPIWAIMSVTVDFLELFFSLEFLPGIEVHPGHLCDPCYTENCVGIRLWYSAACFQFQWGNQQNLWEGKNDWCDADVFCWLCFSSTLKCLPSGVWCMRKECKSLISKSLNLYEVLISLVTFICLCFCRLMQQRNQMERMSRCAVRPWRWWHCVLPSCPQLWTHSVKRRRGRPSS